MRSLQNPATPRYSWGDLVPIRARRMGLVFLPAGLFALLVVARLVHFQLILHNSQNTDRFVDRHLYTIPTRGVITDARGELLAGDVWTYQVVIPALGDMPAHYRGAVSNLVAGVTDRNQNLLDAKLQAELQAFRQRQREEQARVAEGTEEPQQIFSYVVLAESLHLASGQYLDRLQRQGEFAARMWDLHKRGDDAARVQLENLLAPPVAAAAAAGAGDPEPNLQQVMQELGLRTDLDADTADYDFFRHFRLEREPTRYYTQGALGSHVLGLVNADREGVNGIESYYQKFLRGEVNLLAASESIAVLSPEMRRYVPTHMGGDIILTIDRTIQHIVEEELQDAIVRYKVRQGGSALVMEPKTGAILAMANFPDFTPGALDTIDPESTNLVNLAVTGVYEPGSVFKVLTVAAGIDLGVIEPDDEFHDTGEYFIGTHTVIRNSEERVEGQVTATEALAKSLNTIIAEIAVDRIGTKEYYEYLFDFGLGEVTGIDLAHEFNGSLKDKYPGTANWNITDLGTNSFGQGINCTPIQMANALNVIANGGNLMQPYVVQHRIKGDNITTFQPTPLRQEVISPETAHTVTEMMVRVVEDEVYTAQVPGYRIAGKSGTAQVPDPERIGQYSEDVVTASFAGFAPADDPRILVLIILNDPDPNHNVAVWGSQNAAPTFSRITQRILQYMNVPPSCHPLVYANADKDSGPLDASESAKTSSFSCLTP